MNIITEFRNLMWDECKELGIDFDTSLSPLREPEIYFYTRRNMLWKYSYAVPNLEAIEAIVKEGVPIVEMGAGRGYWASLIDRAGGNIICYDIAPIDLERTENTYFLKSRGTHTYYTVAPGTPQDLAGYSNRALFLCWPPYNEDMAASCLRHWKGEILFYVGEGSGGCTGDDEFFDILEKDFEKIEEIDIPTFPSINDSLKIYRRK